VEGLALSEQADVELVARVALDALGKEAHGEVAHQTGETLESRGSQHTGSHDEQRLVRPRRLRNQVERTPDVDLDSAIGYIIDHGGSHHQQRQRRVAHQV